MGCEVRVIRFSLLLNLPIDVKIVHIPFYLTVLLITLFELKKNRKYFKRFLLSTAGDNELNPYKTEKFSTNLENGLRRFIDCGSFSVLTYNMNHEF